MLVISTTNRLDDVEKSLRRGGRLDIDIRFDMPTFLDRMEVLKAHLGDIPNDLSEQDLVQVSQVSSGFVPSDLAQILRNAHILAIKSASGNLTKSLLD